MYITRFLEKKIRAQLEAREIIGVIGPRQSGKTTLMHHIFQSLKNAHFLDFEDRRILELFDEDIESFIELHVKPYNFLFIDEFQYSKDGGKNLKYIYDHHKTKIIVSGSSASGLSIHGIKYLVGRIFVFQLPPFSFDEYLSYKEPKIFSKIYAKTKPLSKPIIETILPHFNEFCIYGGYPRVIQSETPKDKELVLRNIYNTYFLKEIKEILNLPGDHRLSKLIQILALHPGVLANYNELSIATGFPYKDLISQLNVLEKTYITLPSRPFYTNKRTELVKNPKIFFWDNGFRNWIIKNFQPIEERPDKGWLYENFVASELAKRENELKYWRTKSKAEVDFIVEKNGAITPIEVKSSMQQPAISPSFSSFMEKYKPKKGIILSERLMAKRDNIEFQPIFTIGKTV
jgi:predicted AAA+ superfamily ATPase